MRHFAKLLAPLVLAVMFAGHTATAQVYNGVGTTTGGPTWNRPVAGNPPTAPLSGVGTAVRYSTLNFGVTASGNYTFQSTAIGGWDNYLFLYVSSFNALSQFTNVLIGNDDNPTIGLSGFTLALSNSNTYVLVTTGFANSDFGNFTTQISNDANGAVVVDAPVTTTPEPSTYALMTAGLVSLGAAARRRGRKV